MFLRQKGWERLANDGKLGAALFPVTVLAEDDEHQLTADPVTQEELDAMLDVLADSVLIIYGYFRSMAKPSAQGTKAICREEAECEMSDPHRAILNLRPLEWPTTVPRAAYERNASH